MAPEGIIKCLKTGQLAEAGSSWIKRFRTKVGLLRGGALLVVVVLSMIFAPQIAAAGVKPAQTCGCTLYSLVTQVTSRGEIGGSTPNNLAAPIVAVATPSATQSGAAILEVGSDGGVFASGGAQFYGSLPALGIRPASPIVGIAVTQDGGGYWLVGADGGVFAFGDAQYFGSLPGLGLKPSSPIVGILGMGGGGGYWLVGADGGVFTFGDAQYFGSLPGLGLKPSSPIVGVTDTFDNGGYLLVGSDGGVFAFGDAQFLGSAFGTSTSPAIAILPGAFGGYGIVRSDQMIQSYGSFQPYYCRPSVFTRGSSPIKMVAASVTDFSVPTGVTLTCAV